MGVSWHSILGGRSGVKFLGTPFGVADQYPALSITLASSASTLLKTYLSDRGQSDLLRFGSWPGRKLGVPVAVLPNVVTLEGCMGWWLRHSEDRHLAVVRVRLL